MLCEFVGRWGWGSDWVHRRSQLGPYLRYDPLVESCPFIKLMRPISISASRDRIRDLCLNRQSGIEGWFRFGRLGIRKQTITKLTR